MISKPIEKYMACSIAVNFFSSSDIKILLLSEKKKIENRGKIESEGKLGKMKILMKYLQLENEELPKLS